MSLRLIPTPSFDPFDTSDDSSPVRVDSFELVGGSTHQLIWSSNQIATALGYQDSRDLTRKVRDEWSDEIVEGTDFVVLSGDDLRRPKEVGTVGRNAPSAMFLTESGVHLVALLSRQPASRRLRRWLADEVLPSIRQTGGCNTLDARIATRAANALIRAGDKAGARELLRRAFGLSGSSSAASVPAKPHDPRLLAWLEGRPETSAQDVAAVLGITDREAGAALARLGWERRRIMRDRCRSWRYVRPSVSGLVEAK